MKKSILVTGANGYIGSHVVTALIRRGHKVIACDMAFDNVPLDAVRLNADIFNPELDIYDMAGKPDALIHLAWRNGFKHNAETHLSDLPLHIDFLSRMIASGLKRISVMGSMHEVGYFEGAIDASTPTNPQSFYGIAKNSLRQAMELIVRDKDVFFCWLRGFYITGDDERSNSILGKILIAEREGKELFPFTSGKNRYDYITVDGLAEQICAASLQSDYSGIINCCSGQPQSLGDIVEKFIADNGLKIKLQYGAFPDRPYDSPAIWGNADIINEIMKKDEGRG